MNGVVLKYARPPDAAPAPGPPGSWRLFVFRGGAPLPEAGDPSAAAAGPASLPLRPPTTGWLFGRDRGVADIPTDHPSCSKQHAVLQFRRTAAAVAAAAQAAGPGGGGDTAVRPYLIDLGSANGTWLNGDRLEAARFVEVRSGDVVRCGASSREYVVLREDAARGRR